MKRLNLMANAKSLVKSLVIVVLVVLVTHTKGQNIAITDEDGYAPHSSAMLDVKSNTKGLLIPRMTTTEQNDISGPANGLLIFNTTEGKYSYYNGSSWEFVGSNNAFENGLTLSSNVVKLGGSLSETTVITQGSYTMNFNLTGSGDFHILDDGSSALFVRDNGYVGIGTTLPNEKLDVNGSMNVNGNIRFTDNVLLGGSSDYRVYTNLVSFSGDDENGAIVINTNQPMQSSMFRIKIEGSFFAPSGPFDIILEAYASSTQFRYTGYTSVSPYDYEIILAENTTTGNIAVIIGNTGTSWSYPKITVTQFAQGFSTLNDAYADDWTITIEEDLSDYQYQTEVPNVTNINLDDYYTSSQIDGLIDDVDFFNKSGSNLFPDYLTDNLGLGTTAPTGKLEVKGTNADLDTPIFEVKNAEDQTVFAVYPEGVRIYVDDDPQSKAIGNKGGFAVGGFNSAKGYTDDYLIISRDSSRLYYDPNASKATGNKGGFAIGGFSSGKSTAVNFMDLSVENYFIGHESGAATTTGQYNTFFGYEAGASNENGNYNIFIGYQSGLNNEGGFGNTFVGSYSGNRNLNADYNSFIGYRSGYYNKLGSYNTYFGYESGYESGYSTGEDADNNTMIGYRSGYNNRNGDNNVFIGKESGYFNNDGGNNVNIGYRTGYYNADGDYNTYMGYQSGYYAGYGTSGVDPSYNTFAGYQSGYYNRYGAYNTYFGYRAGRGTYSSSTTGSNNVAIGYDAGFDLTTGHDNVFVGYYAGNNNNTGNYNVFIGPEAGQSNTSADYNSFLGYQAGRSTSTGGFNTMMGYLAGYSNTDGVNQAFFGYNSGYANTGDNNTFLGSESGYFSSDGSGNVYVGVGAGRECEGSDNVFIGKGAGMSETNTSNALIIENSQSWGDDYETISLIYGNFTSDYIRVNGSIYYTGGIFDISDKRLKTNFEKINSPLFKLGQIDGLYYNWKVDEYPNMILSKEKQIGVIAQDVEKVFPELVSTDETGFKTVDYVKFTPILIEAIKEQQKQIDALKTENKNKDTEIQQLKTEINKIESLQNQIDELKSLIFSETSK